MREQLIRHFLRPHKLSIQFPLLEDVAAHEYNQDHQERIVATVQPHVIFKEIPELQVVKRIQEQIFGHSEVLPQERVEQHTAKQICARANPPDSGEECRHRFGEPANSYTVETSQVVGSFKTLRTRAQPSYRAKTSQRFFFEEKRSRNKLSGDSEKAFSTVHHCTNSASRATENDVEFIAASSLWAETKDFTRTLAHSRNDIAQLERAGFVVLNFHQQCDDLEARIAVLTRAQSSSSLPSSLSKKLMLSRFQDPSTDTRGAIDPRRHWQGDPCRLSTLFVVQILESLVEATRREGEN